MSAKIRLTLLNSMAASDFEQALDRHRQWGLIDLDLKDQIFGKGILDLSDSEVERAARLIQARGLEVNTLSTVLFQHDIDTERDRHEADLQRGVPRAMEICRVLQPRQVRLIAARSSRRTAGADLAGYLQGSHPWVLPMYRAAVDRLQAAGQQVMIENECHACIFASTTDVLSFFAALDRPGKAGFIWDIQNLWQMGEFPSLAAYEQLKPLIRHCHLKGGQIDGTSTRLRWRTALEDASWPVLEIVRRVVADAAVPVICLNPSHGAPKPGYNYDHLVERDIAFLRREVQEIQ